MMGITAEVDSRVLERRLAGLERQIPFALASSLTRLAVEAQKEVTQALPSIFDRPNPFTMRAISFRSARKTELEAWVYIRSTQAQYLKLQIEGGTRLPKKRAIVLPFDPSTFSAYGGLKKGLVQRLLAMKYVPSKTRATRVVRKGGVFRPALSQGSGRGGGTFSGVPKGRPQSSAGIYLRTKTGFKLMVPYEPTAHYRMRFPFYQMVANSLRLNRQRILNEQVDRAVATATEQSGSS